MTNYIIEFYQVGSNVKVSAIDPVTGKEVSIIGTATQDRNALSHAAVQKLEYVLNKPHLPPDII